MPAAEIVSAQGSVERRGPEGDWAPGELGQLLCDRDAVRTGGNSRAALRLADDAVLRLDERTTLVLADVAPEPEGASFLEVVFGAIHSFSRRPQTLEVDTPYVNATIEGTEFTVRVTETDTAVAVLEGVVRAANEFGDVQIEAGSAAIAGAGAAPRTVLIVDPIETVEWGLYYPPSLSFDDDALAASEALRDARALVAEDRADAAIARLEQAEAPSVEERLYLASLLLSVGQVEDARAVIGDVLAAEPENAAALAQLAVTQVVLLQEAEALETAERALSLDPDDPAAAVALSLAQQALFRLEDARDTLTAASDRSPGSPLVWARLAEIWLTLGYRDRALDAAERAVELDSGLARAWVVRGFAALSAFDTARASSAFARAIALDPADPLPRLGRGVALIREGALEAGRGEIDAAVALDPTRSLLRSYLGKAYFEEGRENLAAQQFEIAKELDPADPTPHLYEAILLQSQNRPGEALAAVQESIDLNDNRAPYRSRLQLDQDLAARGASLGRVYEDLGFIQLGMREATTSLSLDPSNAAAHRFLADIYKNMRRRELARVSELTRSQLLGEVSLNPVQPSLTETNLNLVTAGGPANPGFNELTALFQQDGVRLAATGRVGDDSTLGGEFALAGQHENVAGSLGAFHFESDGFRDNFDVEHTIYTGFAQAALTPDLHVQIEARRRETENGDIELNFDPDDFDPTFRESFDEDSIRFGARYSAGPRHDTILSLTYADRNTRQSFEAGEFFGPGLVTDFEAEIESESRQAEIQHNYADGALSLVVGGSVSDADDAFEALLVTPGFPNFPAGEFDLESDSVKIYGYGSVDLAYGLTMTLGLSYDDMQVGPNDIEELNPKIGLEWRPFEDVRLRAAYTKSVKPPLATNRTIEPTEVAGFNQYFDDSNGVVSQRYGLGVDWTVTDKLFIGAEASWRDLDVPVVLGPDDGLFTEFDEQTHRIYLYALPHPRTPVGVELVYDRFRAKESVVTSAPLSPVPRELDTWSVPVTARYFDPSGFFAGVRGTYVRQRIDREASTGFAEGASNFLLFDADVGYRFPNDRGFASLQVRNITDQNFSYQDDGFREFGDEPSTGPYFPGIGILGQVTLVF